MVGLKLPAAPLKLKAPRYCGHCNAKKFQHESLHFCCGNGSIELATNDYPPALYRLLTSDEDDAMLFRQYIRLYNNLLAFSSLGGKYDADTEKGIYVFKLHGQIYHNLPDLIPGDKGPRYLQLYFYDGQFEATARKDCFNQIRQHIINILMEVTEHNPYARFFRSLREIDIEEDTQILINKNTVVDQRTYNAPTTDEVAVIWPDDTSSSESSSPYIVVRGKSNDPHRIYHHYGCYDPLQYPLLFPYGDCGWSEGITKKSGASQEQGNSAMASAIHTEEHVLEQAAIHTEEDVLEQEATRLADASGTSARHISPREYYAYKLQSRPNNMLLRAGRCLQQYIDDMYVNIENTRLDFFRHNQHAIRADLYQGILDSIESGETNPMNVGRRVILPPTFIGGPRDMKAPLLKCNGFGSTIW
ncbi:uncharacterized protein LOC110712984 [Chenopodium quinoa]|uniref:uncharacterized protein LOC110712984 n=1 Tax=Chenopodium quinoa TaxID=63459 RepID=UPI000B7774B0|nr:uncharacterized protein LOC110712984 [Chenopodium quinoa]